MCAAEYSPVVMCAVIATEPRRQFDLHASTGENSPARTCLTLCGAAPATNGVSSMGLGVLDRQWLGVRDCQ